jgi:hypothetical protein
MIKGIDCCLTDPPKHKRNIFYPILLFLALFLIIPSQKGHCGQVTLAWDPVNVSNLSGYKIYYGTTSRSYQWGRTLGNVTSYVLRGLTPGKTYYAAVSAYTVGSESTYSNEVKFTVPASSQAGDHDFNGDGMADLLWWNRGTGQVGVWFMNGISPIRAQMITGSMDLNWEIVGVGDFNNDGNTDILLRNKTNGGIVVWYMNGSGGVSNIGWIAQSMDLNWEIVGVGDFNNNGNTDILLRNKANGGVVIWYMNGSGGVSNIGWIIQSGDLNWEIVGVGDFNNDGNADILWRNKTNGGVVVWYMNGSGGATNFEWVIQSGDLNWEIVGVGDFNNDGNVDILWRNKTNGGVVVWYLNGTGEVTNFSWIFQSMDLNWEIVGR